jgi:hypothetical protein
MICFFKKCVTNFNHNHDGVKMNQIKENLPITTNNDDKQLFDEMQNTIETEIVESSQFVNRRYMLRHVLTGGIALATAFCLPTDTEAGGCTTCKQCTECNNVPKTVYCTDKTETNDCNALGSSKVECAGVAGGKIDIDCIMPKDGTDA